MGTILIEEKYEECRRMLKDSISRKRYLHSIGVSNTAACLAMRYGGDCQSAYYAGLLHDCAKGMSGGELIERAYKAGIEPSEVELEEPDLLHSKVGSVIAKEKYGIDNEDILSAIYYHTTGRPKMTLNEKIVFVADYIEPNRNGLTDLSRIRTMAFTDIDTAVAMMCRNSIDHLKCSDRLIDRITIDTYEYYSSITGYGQKE
ncbi:MAG: bis(5'-nucleosyl)-tetraphosphatase (symmetrical) YqeK [Lachnospiraceae bacterium]|nr:bis(5'-nucleosyl)-tetraphosphatase (symmetrical) YqeK [Lachnospiraceae bacterium]